MKDDKKITISGFFPFLNDWGTIGSLVAALDSVLRKNTSNYEIIIVDDGSDERSKEILKILEKKFDKLRVISHVKNRGYGGALKSGIANAKMDWVFYTDGDAQYDPRDLQLLIDKLNKNTDVVNGYKIKRSDPWFRKLTGKTYHYFVKSLFNIPIKDTDCDFRLMRRKIFEQVKLESDSGLICAEMVKKISDFGYKFQEVPVHHYWRTSGKSQFFNFKRVSKVVLGLLILWYKLVIKKEHLKNAATKNKQVKTIRA
jgi:glycosyltransferase involved in cell wall biosynthesis